MYTGTQERSKSGKDQRSRKGLGKQVEVEVKGHSGCRLSRAIAIHNLLLSTCEINGARNKLAQCKQRDKGCQAQKSEFTKKLFPGKFTHIDKLYR